MTLGTIAAALTFAPADCGVHASLTCGLWQGSLSSLLYLQPLTRGLACVHLKVHNCVMAPKTSTMQVAELRAALSSVLDEVSSKGRVVRITKRGKVVALLTPVGRKSLEKEPPYGCMADTFEGEVGDVESPVELPLSEWSLREADLL